MTDSEARTVPPTVLLVGKGERMTDALVAALKRRGLSVERSDLAQLVQKAYVLAPDLVVLVGDAAKDRGVAASTGLAGKRATASVPIAVVQEASHLGARLDTFRHGIVAIVPRSASADEMAERIAAIAMEVPERSGEVSRGGAEASVDELVQLFAEQLRTGILSVAAGSDDVSTQVVLRAGRPVDEVVADLVERLRPLVSRAKGPLSYEFFESASSRLAPLDLEIEPDEAAAVLRGARILLIEQRPARSDALTQELRAAGARVVVADGAGVGLARAKRLDPQVVVIDGAGEDGWALGALRMLRRDPHLRWASLLVVEEEQLWRRPDLPDVRALAAAVAPLLEPEKELAQRAEKERAFDVRIEAMGPVRLLHVLTATGRGLRLRLIHPKTSVEIDLSDGLVAGAVARGVIGGPARAEGPAALATFCAVSSGRVKVEHKDAPATTNIMSPVDDALAAADAEQPLVAPSVPPPSLPPATRASLPNGETGSDEGRVVAKLEELLERLGHVVDVPRLLAEAEGTAPPPVSVPRAPATPKLAEPVRIPPASLPDLRSGSPILPVGVASVAPPSIHSMPTQPPAGRRSEPTPPPSMAPGSMHPASRAPNTGLSEAPPAGLDAIDLDDLEVPRETRPTTEWPAATPIGRKDSTLRLGAPYATRARSGEPALAEEPPDELPSGGGGRLWIVLGALAVLAATAGGVGYWWWSTQLGGAQVETDHPTDLAAGDSVDAGAARTAQADAGAPDAGEPDAGGALDAGPPDAGPPVAVGPFGPREGEPIEGTETDFDLPALGIALAPPPSSRRRRARTITELVRTANMLRNRGENDRAEDLYRRALAFDPENTRATAGLVRIYMAEGDAPNAILFGQRLVRLRPSFASNYVLLGDAFELGQNPGAALRAYAHAVELDPRWRPARERLAGHSIPADDPPDDPDEDDTPEE